MLFLKELDAKFNDLFGDIEGVGEVSDNTLTEMLLDDNAGGSSESLLKNIVLTDEKGNDVTFEFLDLIKYNNEEYVVFLPEEESDEAGEVIILKIETSDDGGETYVSVDDEAALTIVFEIFKERNKDVFNFVD